MATFPCFIHPDGKVTLDFPAAFKAFARTLAGNEGELDLRKKRAKRSAKQNRAFHACITPWAMDEGHSIEDLKFDLLREIFGEREVVSALTGEVRKVLAEPHTSTLNTEQFAHLMERTVELAAGCGVILELPDEYNARKQAELKARKKAA